MAKTKYHYPERPQGITEEDWQPLREDANTGSPADTPPPAPPVAEGFTRLVDFIKRQSLEKKLKKDPQAVKRQTAIAAYQKIKKTGS